MDDALIQFSPLKAIKIPLLINRNADFVERPLARSPRRPPPLGNESERLVWVALPTGSLVPKHKDLATPCIPIPTRLTYKPNLRPPPLIGTNPPANHPVSANGDISNKGRTIIVSRQLSVDGNVTFVVGTKFAGIVNRNPQEIPLSQIFDHVSQAELQRFENQDFLEEDVREASQPPPKPRGRPIGSKLIDGRIVLVGASTGQVGTPKLRTQQIRPLVVIPSSSRAVQQGTAFTPSSRTSHLAVKVLVPNGSQQAAVRVPSFNGPQPGHFERVSEIDVSSESSEDELSRQQPTRRPQYAMIAASGLAPLEDSLEEETSREVSVSRTVPHRVAHSYNREQSPKRRRLDTRLPSRPTGPIIPFDGRNAISKPYPGKGTVFDKQFRQSASLTSTTESDRVDYDPLHEQANSLSPKWPRTGPVTVVAKDHPLPPLKSSFLARPDRDHYSAQRQRRRSRNSTPKRTLPSAAYPVFKPPSPADQASHESPAQIEVEDLEMVDMLEIRDEEAEREALLWQFQPTNIQQSEQRSSSRTTSNHIISTPSRNTVFEPGSPPPSAENAIAMARDILNKINGQSQHARPPRPISVQANTPRNPLRNRASLTPHYPRGAKFAPDRLSDSSDRKPYKTRPNHSPSKSKPASSSKIVPLAVNSKASLETPTSSNPRLSGSHPNSPITPATKRPPALNPIKSPRLESAGLTIPTANDSNIRTKPSFSTNGTTSEYRPKVPTPKNDITKYFRPKPSPYKPQPPPLSADHESETESENHPTHSSPNNNPTQNHTHHPPPIHPLDDESTDSAPDVEVPDSETEIQDSIISDSEPGNIYAEKPTQLPEQISHHHRLVRPPALSVGARAEDVDGVGRGGEVVEISSESDGVGF